MFWLPPGRFSTTTGCGQTFCSPAAIERAMVSGEPPGVSGTMIRIGRSGKPCAAAIDAVTASAAQTIDRANTCRPPSSRSTFQLTAGGALCKNDSTSQSGRNNAYPLVSLHCSGSSLFGASGLGPERHARGKRKGAGRRSVQQLPCPYRSHRLRIHARGLEDRHAHDDEPRREHRAGSAWAHDRLSRQDLSRDRQTRGRAGARTREAVDEGMAGGDTGIETTRSAGGARRLALVHRADGECARPRRSEDQPGQGISAQDAPLGAAWPGRGQGRQHLLHGKHRGAGRQARPENRQRHRVQDAGPGRKRPAHLIFDKAGILWFTVQNSNRIGRLDPKSGEIKLLTPPTPKSRPHGMALDSRGNLLVVQFGTNKVVRVDPKTLEIRECTLPDPASRPRRIAITSDDIVWYSDYSRGYLGRLDPATGKVTEWQSPSGPKSAPYG